MSLEKALVQTLEPIIDELAVIKEQIKSIELTPGKDGQDGAPGKDADPVVVEDIIDELVKSYSDLITGKAGERGEKGSDGLGLEVKTWSPDVYREGTYVTHHIGQFFKAVKDTASEPGSDDAWIRIGKSGFRHCGSFDADCQYQDGDTYIKNYGWFVVLNGEHKLIAGRGEKGLKGERGENGLPGVAGTDGADIVAFETKGLAAVLITKDPKGKLSDFSIDFAPAIEKQLELIRQDTINHFEDHIKSLMDVAIFDHDTDPDATPLRFFRGMWYSDVNFNAGDVVIYAGKLYVAVDNNSGQVPGGFSSLTQPMAIDQHWKSMTPSGKGTAAASAMALLRGMSDIDLTNLVDNSTLVWNGVRNVFETWAIKGLFNGGLDLGTPASDTELVTAGAVQDLVGTTLTALQNEIAAIQTGIAHQEGVIDWINTPPAAPAEGDRYLISALPAPTGAWAGKANKIAEWISGSWTFTDPAVGDAHYVDAQSITVIWNGTDWIPLSRQAKVSYQATAPLNPLSGDIWVDSSGVTTSGGKLVIKYYDGTAWRTESGNRTWVQNTDPALDPKNQVRDGDTWLNTTPLP
jgi:hypothetical protein